MKITVICVGRCKEKYWTEACQEYLKRLSRYAKTEVIEVADEKTKEDASDAEDLLVKETEGKRILSKIPEGSYVIVTAILGEKFDSPKMAAKISRIMSNGHSSICFVIGGSLGLSDDVMRRADEKWSFSDLTFPHQMMRVILLEQIYRSFRILNHEPYHK